MSSLATRAFSNAKRAVGGGGGGFRSNLDIFGRGPFPGGVLRGASGIMLTETKQGTQAPARWE